MLPHKCHKIHLYKDYKSEVFQEIVKTIDLGIVPSQIRDIMSLSSIEFLKNDIPILCGTIGNDYKLSKSELFRFDDIYEIYDKFINLYNNLNLLSEYKKNYLNIID